MFFPLSKPASGFAQRQGVSTLPESYHRGRSVSNALGRAALSPAAVHSQRRGGADSPGGSCAPPAPARRLLRHCAVRRVASIRNGYVVLTADQTKTADARTVPVRKNLAAWLAAYPPADLASVTPTVIHRFRTHCPVNWAPDCCRHSYASFAYELTHNATEAAAEPGLRSTGVFFRHDRALAPVGSGSEFFAIKPESVCHRLP